MRVGSAAGVALAHLCKGLAREVAKVQDLERAGPVGTRLPRAVQQQDGFDQLAHRLDLIDGALEPECLLRVRRGVLEQQLQLAAEYGERRAQLVVNGHTRLEAVYAANGRRLSAVRPSAGD